MRAFSDCSAWLRATARVFFVLPCVERQRAGRQRGELGLPVVGEAGEVAGGLRLLLLQRGVRRFGLGLFVAQLLAFFDQFGERLLRRLQRGFGGRDVERGVVGDRRVLLRAAQRAGLARLQLAAVISEAADQTFLFEQLLLVGDLGA